jgi:PBSX family phage portal protein
MSDTAMAVAAPDQVDLVDAAPQPEGMAFTFGEPESVLDRRELFDYAEAAWNGRWYDTPVSFDGLARTFRASTHHSSAIYVKRNILVATFRPHRLLSRDQFSRYALDSLVFGNAYLGRVDAVSRRPMRLERRMAKYMRRGQGDQFFLVNPVGEAFEFPAGSIFHQQDADIDQEVYGLPEYLSALSSALLNESATLFRRRYYLNGSHAGYILYLTDAVHNADDVDALRDAMKRSKGPGNFRNLFMYAPNGKKDGVQVIPLSEVTAKDEFFNIKNITRDDVLAAHRVPPQLLGIVPSNSGGFGAIAPAAKVFAANELRPLQARLAAVNEWIGEEVVTFDPYQVDDTD